MVLKTDKYITCDASKFRGYMGNKFKNYPLLHNHYSKENYLYSYPLVQYHVIDGQPSIFAIEEGVDVLKEISSDIVELELDKKYNVLEKVIYDKKFDINTSNKEYTYEFVSPWLALNPKNYNKYKIINNWKDKKLFLNKILIGNILSMSKGLGIIVNRRIYPKTFLQPLTVSYKSVNMLAFIGKFTIKFKLPNYLGLGKGVSHGFGCIKRVNDS